MNKTSKLFPVSVTVAVTAFHALSAAAAEYVWDGVSARYGEDVSVTFDAEGRVMKLVSTVPDGMEAVFTGGKPVAFADDAQIELSSPGNIVFSNEVKTAGRLACASTRVGELSLPGDSGFKPGYERLIPGSRCFRLQCVSFNAGRIYYGTSSVSAAAYHEDFSEGRRTLQLQNWNGAWTRCVKIALFETPEGIVVSNMYARCTKSAGVNILGEDFDGELSSDVYDAQFYLSDLAFSVDHSADAPKVVFAGTFPADSEIEVNDSVHAVVTGAAVGAAGAEEIPLDIIFNDGSFTFLDCGKFTYSGSVSGIGGRLTFASTGVSEPTEAAVFRFAGPLTTTAQTVLENTSVLDITDTFATVRFTNYNNDGEAVMHDEYRGRLKNAFFRNIGSGTVVRYQARNDSIAYMGGVLFRQSGKDVVASLVTGYDTWISQQPTAADPWTWDPVNDPTTAPNRYLDLSKVHISDVDIHLRAPSGSLDRVTDVTLAGTDSSTGVVYAFKPGANRMMLATAVGISSLAQHSGGIEVGDGATLVLDCPDVADTAATRYKGLWQSDSPAKITVSDGGRLLTENGSQLHGKQTLVLNGGVFSARASDRVDSYGSHYYLFCTSKNTGYLGTISYFDGARTEGYNILLGDQGRHPTVVVGGSAASTAGQALKVIGNNSPTSPIVATFDVADVTASAAADFTVKGGVSRGIDSYVRFIKQGAGTMCVEKPIDLPSYPLRLLGGTLLMGCANCLETACGISLEGGALASSAGMTHVVGGPVVLNSDSSIVLAEGSGIVIPDSSGAVWTDDAILSITGDVGNAVIRFGAGADGLTKRQLEQVRVNGKPAMLRTDGRIVEKTNFVLKLR